MKRTRAVVAFLLFFGAFDARPQNAVWTPVKPPIEPGDVVVADGFFRIYALDAHALSSALNRAPREGNPGARSEAEIVLPLSDGTFTQVSVVESPIMDSQMAAQLGGFHTYLVHGLDDHSLSGRLDFSPYGFHAAFSQSKRTVYIAPYRRGDTVHYISYDTDAVTITKPFTCGVTGSSLTSKPLRTPVTSGVGANTGSLRTYRLAVAATAEFTIGVSPPGTLDIPGTLRTIATLINNVNAIYERDLAIRFVLVPKMSLLVFTDPNTDPYTNPSNDNLTLGQNQAVIDTRIGAANYDIGHVLSDPANSSGLSQPNVACANGWKALGLSGGVSDTGIRSTYTVAHELGHQLGASHTFDADTGDCQGNREPSTAYEPGRGTTIMSYAQASCTPIIPGATIDLFFHSKSIEQIINYSVLGAGNACPALTGVLNLPPVLSPLLHHTIPQDTPFVLKTFAIDPNEGDGVTVSFEQIDLDSIFANGPIFRFREPDASGSRTFPIMIDALAGRQTFGEILPANGRTLTFRALARDNHMGAGNVTWEDFQLTVEGLPFRVLVPNAPGVIWPAGSQQPVVWTPNGASHNVNILLSTNSGVTWSTLLPNAPNTGIAAVTVPNVTSRQCRIKVEAADNIFFNVTQNDFLIYIPPPVPSFEGEQRSTTCNSVVGWAWDKANPQNTANVDIFELINGNLLQRETTWPANGPSPGLGDGTSAFFWPLPRSLKDGSIRSFVVRFHGTAIDLQGAPQSTTACALDGAVDSVSCSSIKGWAQDPSAPGDAISVDAFAVNTSTGQATQLAKGWLASKPGSHGFHDFEIPVSIPVDSAVFVSFSDTQKSLSHSPTAVSCP